uniref:Uncharacterized protein n=1 Tax=Panagrolaimus davidi TaxID=227884 RepID=A0A914QTA2_9BILA
MLVFFRFKAIVQGKNPQPEPMKVSDKPAISKAKMHKAAERLLGMQEKLQMDRQKFKMQMKELKKKQNAEKIADILSGLVSTKKPVKKIKSSNKFKPNAIKKKGHHKSTSATASRRHKLPSKGKISKKQRQ